MHNRHIPSGRNIPSHRKSEPLSLDAQATLARGSSSNAFLNDEREHVVQGRLPDCAYFRRGDVGAECKSALEDAAGDFGARGGVPEAFV